MLKQRRRGSILVLALLLVVLIATIGLATIAGVSGTYAASRGNVATFRASSLAQMGIEDLLVKLAKDPFFPDGVSNDYKEFSYQEIVLGENDEEIGIYTCTVNWTNEENGYYELTAVGNLGDIQEPKARYQIRTKLMLTDFTTQDWSEGKLEG